MTKTLRRYGLIGNPLQHSLSPFIHERLMEAAGIKGEYRLYELQENELAAELPRLLQKLDGFNCTIPFKQAVIPYLQGLAPSAQLYGAVNTVYQGFGHNTDGSGFRSCQVPLAGKRVCILGAGGVARVLAWEAARGGAREIIVQARRAQQAQEVVRMVQAQRYAPITAADSASLGPCDVLLNGTPVGMWPQIAGLPVPVEQIQGAEAVFDTIYNPTATRLVLKARSQGLWAKGGLQMLFEQAVEAQRIWNPEVDFASLQDELDQIRRELARQVLKQSPIKFVLSGFMGAGKTHVGKLLAQSLGLPFVDLDESIVQRTQITIPEVFAQQGEGAFRSLERECLQAELSVPGPLVLAAGGGTLIQQGAADLIHSLGGLIIYLDVPLETALERCGNHGDRPLLRGGADAAALYEQRLPLYQETADFRVESQGKDRDIVTAILTAFELEV